MFKKIIQMSKSYKIKKIIKTIIDFYIIKDFYILRN